MEAPEVCILAAQIRSSNPHKANILTLSTQTLSSLIPSFDQLDEQSTSFHLKPYNSKTETLKDLKFLSNYIQQTKTFKLFGEIPEGQTVNLNHFKSLLCLEFYKVDANKVRGLQGLRVQLQKIVCQKNLNSLEDILSKCGGDESEPYCWNELKEASFVNNGVVELGQSLECAPWLHTLDLSHNDITNIEWLSCLHNLKHLNLAYNKLEVFPMLKGQICGRLQNLILKNNFIEDISGLRSLCNLSVLDLSTNCLVDHKCLIAVSHLATLQFLNLESNPISFHPNHRHKTCCYLHANTGSTQFVLNSASLSKNEKKLLGSFHPQCNSNLMTDSVNLTGEKSRRVREVVIEDDLDEREIEVPVLPPTPQMHLETKKQIEDLHEKFGESWLNSQSGLLDVLGLESYSQQLSTSPYDADFTIYSNEDRNQTKTEIATEVQVQELNDEYAEKPETELSVEEPDIEEESIFLANIQNEEDPIFIVIGQTHISERECSTGNEREKWHVNSMLNCEVRDNQVLLDFDTMRKDKKQRVYIFEEEIEQFVSCVQNKINSRSPKKSDEVRFQCMRCNKDFGVVRNGSILKEDVLKCPNCDSTLMVEV